jgi:hypothetical protein
MNEQQDPGPAQQPEAGVDNLQGGGEFPSPDAPPTGPAPGTDPQRRQEIEESRQGDPMDRSGSSTADEVDQTGVERSGTGAARVTEAAVDDAGEATSPPHGYKEALERDPVLGGSGSAPRTERH